MNKNKSSILNAIRIIIIVVLLGVVTYEAVMIYHDQKEYAVAVNEYDEIADTFVEEVPSETVPVSEEEEVRVPNLNIDFAALKKLNSDFIGWIYFPAVHITYPIVKEQEINQYLYKTFDGTNNKAGSIFMDVLGSSDFSGPSDMLFGHNMKNGSMFGKLKELYQEKDNNLLIDNPYVFIYTENETFVYKVFAYYVTTDGSYSYTEVKSDEDYDDYIAYVSRNSMIEFPEDADFSSHPPLLTLSTCSGQSGSGKRFVVHTYRTGLIGR